MATKHRYVAARLGVGAVARRLRSSMPHLLAASLLSGTIAAQEPATVEVVPARAAAVSGTTTKFRAIVRDAAGKVIDQAQVVWFAVPYDVAKADREGTVTTFRPAQVTVFARAGRLTGTARLDVAERPLAKLTVKTAEGTTTVVGGVLQLDSQGATQVGDLLEDVAVQWRSLTPAVATVSPSGLVTGHAQGTAGIVAESGGVTGEIQVTVRPNPVRSITIAPPPTQVRAGDVVRLFATPLDGRGGKADPELVRWSVRGRGAVVEPNGRFVAERPGAYPVTASVGTTAATTSIRVVPRAEHRRIELITRVRLPKDFQVGEIWPIGDAIYVCSNQGRVYVFDIRKPEAPVLTDSIMADARSINDVSTTEDGKIGVLTREGASSRKNGLVFFDASDIHHPRVLSEFTETVSGGVHSAFIYQHYVFATDDATGSLRIIDFGDPVNPRQIVRWEIPREISEALPGMKPERYLHDVYVKDGLAYLAYWRDGLVILDVGQGIKGGTIQAPKLVSQFRYNYAELYPPDFIAGTHAVFRDANYLFITDEVLPGTYNPEDRDKVTTRGVMQVIDVSDIERPRKVAQYDPVEFGAHNVWVENGVAYIGAWDGGARLLDVSGELLGDLREQGRVIGKLDTTRPDAYRPNQGLVWSTIPHRGYFYAGDKGTGLWVGRLTEPKLIP
ncbi:MAG: hypothetical protein ABI647_24835 [Gemmatimonadota bacterium]